MLELLDIEFVRNTNPENFFNVYQNTFNLLDDIANDYETISGFEDFFETDPNNVTEQRLNIPDGANNFINEIVTNNSALTDDDQENIGIIQERRDRLIENNFIFSSNFSFQKDNRADTNDNSFYQYRLSLESTGNLLSAFSNLVSFNTDELGQKTIFGIPYSQYVKTDFEYIRHWDLNNENVLALRGVFGLAVPYGNSSSIPFVRSYFAGGANDNRAWQVYSLGPGTTENTNEFNEANFKLGFNLEYRFPIVGAIKGALFTDVGNIWNVFDNVDDEGATFNGIESLGDIAIGTGVGLRYDLSYFIFRFDLGFKTYNPALIGSERWFTDYFSESVFNIGINYPF